MKNRKIYQIVGFTVLCILVNAGGRALALTLGWPLWLDSLGTMLNAYIAGPVCGAMVGMTSNLLYGTFNSQALGYGLTSMAVGLIVGLAARKRWLDSLYGAMKAASLTMLVAATVSVPLNWIFNEGMTGNRWGDAVIRYLESRGWPLVISTVIGQTLLEFTDKVLLLLIVYLLIRLVRWYTHRNGEDIVAAGVVVLCLALCAAGGTAYAAEAGPGDYNDYVQTVYSGDNGLPCGQANDIAQTHDGVLWIGTYAGLYRYNGTDFRWIDSYDSVRNVNCLYVDAEGRLWIGTNDNGLSIAINESVVNVIDQNSGLPSNSVRSIIQSSDGDYYVGTTSSLQILTMSNGLRAVNTLREINYADCMAADGDGRVAALTSDGRLFLLKSGRIQASLRLTEGNEVFNCCAFAPDGALMAGTSGQRVHRYDVSGNAFRLMDTVTLDGVSRLNRLTYLEDGTLFITSDSGVAYIAADGALRLVNTNSFNSSIYKVMQDYQGNLWLTSTRLGLLRLAHSSFRDVYGTIGMERRVVNAVTEWQGRYYIGTDKGMDIIDTACRTQLTDSLSEALAGRRIRCVYTDSRGYLWVCTYGDGLMEVSPGGETWVYDETNGGFGSRARLVTELSDGTVIAGGDTGISYIRDHTVQRTIRNQDGLINSLILTLTECADGTVLAGTDGDGIAVLKDGAVERFITQRDGLTSGVILRTVRDPKADGVLLVTSNGLCYLESDGTARPISHFPYYNNYDIRVCNQDTLMVMSSAGIYVVSRDDLVSDRENMPCELLDARNGLTTALTANSWSYANAQGELFLPCDTGVYIIDTARYHHEADTYRMRLASLRYDGAAQPLPRTGVITVGQGVEGVEIVPEVLNYTIRDPNVGYCLDGYETRWTIVPQSKLSSLTYTNLPAGEYTLRLAVFDTAGENVLEEQQLKLVKEGELYERPGFTVYLLLVLAAFIIWFTWLIVERQLTKQRVKLAMANETVMAIANAVDAKDVRTSQHSRRVAEYAVMIAREMKCFPWWQRRKKLENLREAAQMHDIGKIGIKDQVLNKVGRLTDEEYAQMKSHVTQGADILKDFTLVEHVVDGARYHHERYDGRGYPDGLKGEEIPLYGRIIGVADAFDAMTSNRVYRNQMDTDYVLNELKRGRGTQFDPDALDAFMRLIDRGVIDLNQLYARKAAEIGDADQKAKEETARRMEEDRKIQEAEMKAEAQRRGAAQGKEGGA